MTVPSVASNAPATSAWANQVADDVNATLPDNTAPVTQAIGDAAAAGASAKAARRDHKHGMPAFGAVTAESTFGGSAADGSAATVARSDHRHGNPLFVSGSVVSETTYGQAPSGGSGTGVALSNHTHGTPPLPTPAQLGSPVVYDAPATLAGGKKIYVGAAAPSGPAEGDIWIKG